MSRTYMHILLLGALCLPSACASTGDEAGVRPLPPALDESDQVAQILYHHYENWKGVKYREGGLGRNGIDCSGFVHLTFRRKFGIELPRSTEQLIGMGAKVSRDRLKPGDLVFFKTGLKKRHVGIYLEEGIFLHASTSQGVVLSDLSSDYWQARYWTARRLGI